ncbi:MAG: hypothetical protein HYZ53_22180 [Planctomycetes bacterium]|nr:hypothetical protein [Planctomycetota bacterium]
MSLARNRLVIVPADPEFVPETGSQDALRNILAALAPPDAFRIRVHSRPVFVDPGGVGEICCPNCRELLPNAWWRLAMAEARAGGFGRLLVRAPCCQRQTTLNDLVYEYPARFGRWVAEIAEPVRAPLDGETRRVEAALGCPIRYVRVRG